MSFKFRRVSHPGCATRAIALLISTTDPRHPRLVMALHWLSVLAVVAALSAIWTREAVHGRPVREALLLLHRNAGWLVLPLLLARLTSRMVWRARTPATFLPPLMRLASQASHLALYATLALLPMAGWLLSSARGQTIMLFGRIPLPSLLEPDPDLADTWKERHELLAWVLVALVILHVVAALWHHFIRRDGVLRSMLPAGRDSTSSNQP